MGMGFLAPNARFGTVGPTVHRTHLLAAAQNVDELFTHGLLFHQLIARLFGKRLEVAHRPHIGGHHLQQLAAGHFCQGLWL